MIITAVQSVLTAAGQNLPPLRPPAVPLVACDPYFSIWSPADKLTDADTVHWTGKPHRLTSMVKIGDKVFRLMGKEPANVPALPQTNLEVLPTRTIYTFEGEGVRLTLTFMTPALPEDLALLSEPVTYVTWATTALDGKEHPIGVYFDCAGEITVNEPSQEVSYAFDVWYGTPIHRLQSVEQPILQKKGDDLRIDWGEFLVSEPIGFRATEVFVGSLEQARRWFTTDDIIESDWPELKTPDPRLVSSGMYIKPDWRIPRRADEGLPGLALTFTWQLKTADGRDGDSRTILLGYDDRYSIQYFKKNLEPYWKKQHGNIFRGSGGDLVGDAGHNFEKRKKMCAAFDSELMADLRQAGGEKYSRLAALAYRQCFAAGKFVADANGQPLQFCKENHSNGCVGTSDVFYPMAPQFLLFGPSLAKSFLVPFMNYAASERWKFPFAPHDLGTYPHANGQVYGGGERNERDQMPVEESGNLLILMAAVAQMEGNADFAGLYWKQLEQWAEYLKAKGFDPENQLCTDDFAGHLAHNVNLSAKAIIGLGAFGKLCELRGRPLTPSLSPSDGERVAKPGEGKEWIIKGDVYSKLAKEFAARWVKEAADGDHYRLAFDRPDTWSQKYNLIWDRILDLNLFPAEVARKEMDFYKKHQNQYGLPLDNRKDYTKLDWITWTATLTQSRADFEALIDPVYAFLNATPDRSPMTDWYETKDAKKVGFTARPVVGGVFAQLLYDKAVWKRWASRDKTKAGNWAPIPQMPKITAVVPAADKQSAIWRYTTVKPTEDWMKSGFNDSPGSAGIPAGESATLAKSAGKDAGAPRTWKEGKSGFGTEGTPGAVIGTTWNTPDIWLRREVEIPADKLKNLELWIHHDEDAEIYINGVAAAHPQGYVSDYFNRPPNAAGLAALKPGKNLIAVHCHQTGGGQYIDVGFVEVVAVEK